MSETTNHKLHMLELPTTSSYDVTYSKVYAGMEPTNSINFYSGTDIEAVCYDKLKSARRHLMQARSLARDDIERGQVIAKPGSITPHKQFINEKPSS